MDKKLIIAPIVSALLILISFISAKYIPDEAAGIILIFVIGFGIVYICLWMLEDPNKK